MPDREQGRFSRVCPSCGRRVPGNVNTCRCGTTLNTAASASPERQTPVLSAVAVPLLFALASGAAWAYFRPAEPETPQAMARHSIGPPPQRDGIYLDPILAGPPRTAPSNTSAKAVVATPPATTAAIAEAPAGEFEDVVARVMPAVVQIESTSGKGSAFFIAYDTLITNAHVVNQDGYVTVKGADGASGTARVERLAPSFDLALLKMAQPSPSQPFIPVGTARGLREGQPVIAIGSALGTLLNTVTRGVVSGLRSSGGATLIQNDAAINPGNSGGPLLDRQGRAIGVTTMTATDKPSISFAVAIDHVSDLMAGRLRDGGTAQRGLLDVQAASRPAESDRRKQQGEQELRSGLAQLVTAARDIDAGWKEFREDCYHAPIAGSYQRQWFAVLVPRAIPTDAAAGCVSYYNALESNIKQFQGLMRRLLTDARRADVLPGTIRDELRNTRLDFDWDR